MASYRGMVTTIRTSELDAMRAEIDALRTEVERLSEIVTECDGVECIKHDAIVRGAMKERDEAEARAEAAEKERDYEHAWKESFSAQAEKLTETVEALSEKNAQYRAALEAVEGDKELLDFLNDLTVATIYLDSGEIIDVRGEDVRAAIRAVIGRIRCCKCRALLPSDLEDGDFCPGCEGEELPDCQRQLALADAPVEGETEHRIIPGPDGEL